MTVFLSFMLATVVLGIFMRHRPYYQTQILVVLMSGVAAVCYFFFGML